MVHKRKTRRARPNRRCHRNTKSRKMRGGDLTENNIKNFKKKALDVIAESSYETPAGLIQKLVDEMHYGKFGKVIIEGKDGKTYDYTCDYFSHPNKYYLKAAEGNMEYYITIAEISGRDIIG